jgi:hypothetical protein
MSMKVIRASAARAALLLAGLVTASAQAASYNLNLILANPGFESGLTSWSYSGHIVNANTYLTTSEWAAQNWSSSSPFYSDAQLATLYPGKPWGANPAITHIDQGAPGGDPTTVIAAAIGSGFVGSRQNGYQGHCISAGSACGPASAFYDTNFQIYQTITGSFAVGDIFSLTIWGNRGRLTSGSSAGSSELRAAVCSQSNLNNPCSSSLVQSFTNWSTDGQWTSQTLNFTLTSVAASQDIRVQLTGINSNHDRYVAVDLGAQAVPVPAAVWLFSGALAAVGWLRRSQATA